MVKPLSGLLQPRNNLTWSSRNARLSEPREMRSRSTNHRRLMVEERSTPRKPKDPIVPERQISPKRSRIDSGSASTLEDSPKLLDNDSEDEADELSQNPASKRKRRRTELNTAGENGQSRGWQTSRRPEDRTGVDAMMDSSNYPSWSRAQKLSNKLRPASSIDTPESTQAFPKDIVSIHKIDFGTHHRQQPPRPSAARASSGSDKGTQVRFALNYFYANGTQLDFDEVVLFTNGGTRELRYQKEGVYENNCTNLDHVVKVIVSNASSGKKIRLQQRGRGTLWIDLEMHRPADLDSFKGILKSYNSITMQDKTEQWLEDARINAERQETIHHGHLDADLAESSLRQRENARSSGREQINEPRRRLSARLESNQIHSRSNPTDNVPTTFSTTREQTPTRLTRRSTRLSGDSAPVQRMAEAKPSGKLSNGNHASTDDPSALMAARYSDFGSKWKRPLVYPPDGKKRATVEYEDLLRLDDGEFLNDNIIGFYLRYLMHMIEDARPHDAKRIYWFNSYFFEKLTDSPRTRGSINYDAVKRWTRDVDLFAYDYIVVPVNENAHWYLVLICNLPRLFQNETLEHQEETKAPGSSPHHPIGIDESQESNEKRDAKPAADTSCNEVPNERIDILATRQSIPAGSSDPVMEVPVSPDGRRAANPDIIATADTLDIPKPSDLFTERKVLGDITDSVDRSPSARWRAAQRKKKRPSIRQFDPSTPAVITLDSLGNVHPGTTRALKQYLVQEAVDKKGNAPFDESNLQGMNAKGIPLQDNFCDCGPYLLAYLDKFTKDPSGFVSKLLQKEFDEESDWPTQLQPSQMRNNIRKLILRLYREQHSGARKAKQVSLPLASDPINAEDMMGEPPEASHPASDAVVAAQELSKDVIKSSIEESPTTGPTVSHFDVSRSTRARDSQKVLPIDSTVIPDSQEGVDYSLRFPRYLHRKSPTSYSADRMAVDARSSPPTFEEQLQRAAAADQPSDLILLDNDA